MKKRNTSDRFSLAKRIIDDLTNLRKQQIVDIRELKSAKIRAEELEATIVSEKELSRLDPLHAVYVYGQNKMSAFVEQLAELPALSNLAAACADAEQKYLPSGPPMSPLTRSYFWCWCFFDLCVGVEKESFGTITIEICNALNVDEGLIKVFEKMQRSRMGFYVHEGFSNQQVLLRELVTEKRIKVVVPSGHKGQPGEIWLARVMPEPFEEIHFGYSVVFTTPYVLGKVVGNSFYQVGDEGEWKSFFGRSLGKVEEGNEISAYERLMKFGLNRHYWNDYIFEAFVNYAQEAILLSGFPDIPLSRPHSRESSRNR